jgi:hypothetical protein
MAIDNFFQTRTMYEVARELKIRRDDFPDDLEEMEVCTIREQFVAAKWNYPVWEKAMLGFGLKQLETYKLFQLLGKTCDDFEAAKATPTV